MPCRAGWNGRVTAAACLATPHSAGFVAGWRAVWCSVFGWRCEGRFAAVPTLLGSRTLAYLPGLSYSDLAGGEAKQLAQEAQGRSFNIRVLGAPQPAHELPDGAPTVLRINLAGFGHAGAQIWERGLSRAARYRVRRARKAGLVAAEEAGSAAQKAFRAMLRLANARHGAPMLPQALFEALASELGARLLVVRGADRRPQAGLLWLRDGPLAWVPWSGAQRHAESPGNLLFWAMIEQALNDGADILDLGRSAVGHGSYRFKRSFGAAPVPVHWLSDKPANLYDRYMLAQRAWRALPLGLADRLGPTVCRYLADY